MAEVEKIVYECPGCGWQITEVQWEYVRHNFPCPKCGQYGVSSFKKGVVQCQE